MRGGHKMEDGRVATLLTKRVALVALMAGRAGGIDGGRERVRVDRREAPRKLGVPHG